MKMKAAQEEPEYTEAYPHVPNPEQVSEWEKYFYSAPVQSRNKDDTSVSCRQIQT